jgi:Na+/phosphate symporter
MKDYLAELTRRALSKRQAILVQYLDRCMSDLERIGDHIETLCTLSLRRRKFPEAVVDRLSFSIFFQLYEAVLHVFKLLIQSFDPDRDPSPTSPTRSCWPATTTCRPASSPAPTSTSRSPSAP